MLRKLHEWLKLKEGLSPTYRELARFCECKSVRTITEHVHALIRKGLVLHVPKELRTLSISADGEKLLGEKSRETIPWNIRIG